MPCEWPMGQPSGEKVHGHRHEDGEGPGPISDTSDVELLLPQRGDSASNPSSLRTGHMVAHQPAICAVAATKSRPLCVSPSGQLHRDPTSQRPPTDPAQRPSCNQHVSCSPRTTGHASPRKACHTAALHGPQQEARPPSVADPQNNHLQLT